MAAHSEYSTLQYEFNSFYNQATSNLAIYSHETSQDKLPEA